MQQNRIKFDNNEFTCVECENSVKALSGSEEGMVEIDLGDVKKTLSEFPSKTIYGICPVCGMEYLFVLENDQLFLEPSDEEK